MAFISDAKQLHLLTYLVKLNLGSRVSSCRLRWWAKRTVCYLRVHISRGRGNFWRSGVGLCIPVKHFGDAASPKLVWYFLLIWVPWSRLSLVSYFGARRNNNISLRTSYRKASSADVSHDVIRGINSFPAPCGAAWRRTATCGAMRMVRVVTYAKSHTVKAPPAVPLLQNKPETYGNGT